MLSRKNLNFIQLPGTVSNNHCSWLRKQIVVFQIFIYVLYRAEFLVGFYIWQTICNWQCLGPFCFLSKTKFTCMCKFCFWFSGTAIWFHVLSFGGLTMCKCILVMVCKQMNLQCRRFRGLKLGYTMTAKPTMYSNV